MRGTHWATRNPLGHSFDGFFSPLRASVVMAQWASVPDCCALEKDIWALPMSKQAKWKLELNIPRPSSSGKWDKEDGVWGMSQLGEGTVGINLTCSSHISFPGCPGVASAHSGISENRKRMKIQGLERQGYKMVVLEFQGTSTFELLPQQHWERTIGHS
jgi:hypothetical protein